MTDSWPASPYDIEEGTEYVREVVTSEGREERTVRVTSIEQDDDGSITVTTEEVDA